MTRSKLQWVLVAGVAALLAGGSAEVWAGPGSGDEVGTKVVDKRALVRKWRYSKARRAQLRRIRELKTKIALLRKAVPKLQTAAMNEASYHQRWASGYQRRRASFLSKWRKVVRLMGKAPVKLHSDYFANFGLTGIWTADTADWKKRYRRRNQADGDDFYLYANFNVPVSLVRKKHYVIDWSISGYDFNGRLQNLYNKYASRKDYKRFRFTKTMLRRRISGLGLTPGWYYVRGTLRVQYAYHLKREFYSAVYISRVNPKISAPPPRWYKYPRAKAIKITKLHVRSRGAPKDQINPKSVFIRGRYEVAKAFTGHDSQLLVGASLYVVGRYGKVGIRQLPMRTAYRFRQRLRRTKGSFGSPDTTRIKNLQEGLRPGKYALRIWIMVSGKKWQNYWAYEDKYFEVKPLRRLPTGGRR